MNIFLTPGAQLAHSSIRETDFAERDFPEEQLEELLYYQNGKAAIHHIVQSLGLSRDDEVWITTTTESSFVSSCVTCTVFNYAKVSRVPTPATRLIWIIHEFGFPHPRTFELVEYGKKHGIAVVEDSAHSMDSYLEGHRLGTIADAGIHSLPKSIPVTEGGILRINPGAKFEPDLLKYEAYAPAARALEDHLPRLRSYSDMRRKNYGRYAEALADFPTIYRLDEHINPFVFGFQTDRWVEIYQSLDRPSDGIQLGRSHVDGWVLLPVNQFIEPERIEDLITLVTSAMYNGKQ